MKALLKRIAIFMLSFTITPLCANIIRVPGDQPTIQIGINAASNRDTVVIYPGTYFENIILRGKSIVVTSRFYETGDMSFIQSTVINGSQPSHSDTASCVLFINHEDSTSIIQGLTITGGRGTKWKDEHSSGTYREGGGILVAFASPTIQNNLIINNEAIDKSGVTDAGGGGIRAGDGNPRILNNIIAQNKGQYGGSGIVLNWTGVIMRNNILAKNSGGHDDGGGALWVNNNGPSPKIIENNTFADNQLLAIYLWEGAVTIRNSIIWGNTPTSGSQIGKNSGVVTLSYCDIQGGLSGTGNIANDPLFSDSLYHLSTTSPCIDSGDTASIFNDVENPLLSGIVRWPSQGGLRDDIGAYGGAGASELPFFSAPTEVKSPPTYHPVEFRLNQNYPNPFNPSTTIVFSVETYSHTSLRVYDLLGREVATIFSGELQAGNYAMRWNADSLPSGVYFYRLQAGSFTETKKLMLLR
jgi:Secretion system C-terminal sorting domain